VLTNHTITGGIAVGGGLLTMGGTIGNAGSTFTLSTGGGFSAGAVAINGTGVGAVTEGYSGIGTADFANTGVGSSVWQGGTRQVFQFKGVTTDTNVQTQAGPDWDLINNNFNALLITATIGNKMTILLEGLSSLTEVGLVGTFSPTTTTDYKWLYATNVGAVDVSAFEFDQRGVWSSGSFAGGYGANTFANGSFYVSTSANNLYIHYTSVPEPGSIFLVTLAAMGMGGYGWRRRKKKGQATGDEDPVTGAAGAVVVVEAAAIEGPSAAQSGNPS
jgi:hypothetical protein